jgi:ubiquitin-protein ligase
MQDPCCKMSKRIQKEIKDATQNDSYNFFYDEQGMFGRQYCCYLRFIIQQGVYTGQTHIIRLSFWSGTVDQPRVFPINAPSVVFETPIYHPNISTSGGVCLDILQDKWSPMFSITVIYNTILLLLENPNPKSPLNIEAAKEISNPELFAEHVRQHYFTQLTRRADILLAAECLQTKKI